MGKIGQGDGHAWGVGEAGTSMGAGGVHVEVTGDSCAWSSERMVPKQ